MASTFGIYVKTFKPDHYLAKVLMASIRHYAPGVDITLIPDDGFTAPMLWGEKVMNVDDPFLLGLKGYYKKLWVFFGPYERFIYLDADMLVLRPLDRLVERVMNQTRPFCCVCAETKVLAALAEGDAETRDRIIRKTIGDARLLESFDRSYRFRDVFPFNSGFFATDRSVVALEELKEIIDRIEELHSEYGLPPLGNSRAGVFYGDQGLMNYLMFKNGIKLDLLRDIFVWGGKAIPSTGPVAHGRISPPEMFLPGRNGYVSTMSITKSART